MSAPDELPAPEVLHHVFYRKGPGLWRLLESFDSAEERDTGVARFKMAYGERNLHLVTFKTEDPAYAILESLGKRTVEIATTVDSDQMPMYYVLTTQHAKMYEADDNSDVLMFIGQFDSDEIPSFNSIWSLMEYLREHDLHLTKSDYDYACMAY